MTVTSTPAVAYCSISNSSDTVPLVSELALIHNCKCVRSFVQSFVLCFVPCFDTVDGMAELSVGVTVI